METYLVRLTADQIDRLIELVSEHRKSVARGEISGYANTYQDELVELDTLVDALREDRPWI